MSHQVYILWFGNNTGNDYHWSLFVAPINSTKGVKYDALSSTNLSNVLEWNYSHLPGYDMRQSSSFGDSVMLGVITDVEGFKTLMLSTPLPISGENCQTWVRKVVQEAVKQKSLPTSATVQIGTVPVRT